MQIDRRKMIAGTVGFALGGGFTARAGAAEATDQRGLFWQIARSTQMLATIFGYERTSAAIAAAIIQDGDRLVQASQGVLGAMPNFVLPKVDLSHTGVAPLLGRLSPPLAARVRGVISKIPQMQVISIDQLDGIAFLSLILMEGQRPSAVTVGGTIAQHAQQAGKSLSYLLSLDDIKSVYLQPDVTAFEKKVDDAAVSYLLDLRDRIGPIGAYLETAYIERRWFDIKRVGDDMIAHDIPQLEAVSGLPPDRLEAALAMRTRDLLSGAASNGAFIMIPLGVVVGPSDLLGQLRKAGMTVSLVA